MVRAMDWDEVSKLNGSMWFDTWIVIYENSSSDRTMVGQPRRPGIVIFGSALAGWVLVLGLLLCLALLVKKRHVPRRPLHWHVLNFTVSQLLAGTIIVPLNVRTERLGYWGLGGATCRMWLLAQVFVATLGFWAALMASVDRFVFVLQPFLYRRRMSTRRALALIGITWFIAAVTLVPPSVNMAQDPDVVLEEVCAMSMTHHYAFGISCAAFFVPAVLLCLTTMGVLWFAMQSEHRRQPLGTSDPAMADSSTRFCADYVESAGVTGSAGTLTAVNIAVVALWAPFYVVNLMVPFCNGMCVPPVLWSAFLWLGYASAGVSPLLWLFEPSVRRRCWRLMQCSQEEATTCTPRRCDKGDYEDEVKLFKSNTDRDSCKEYTM